MSVETIAVEQAARPFFLGVDVGGTTIKVGVIDDAGRPIIATSFPTADHLGPANAVERIRARVDSTLETMGLSIADLTAIGLGTPGTHNLKTGMILEPPNMKGWRNFPIRDSLKKAFNGLNVTYANDAGAAAYGEFWVGSAKDFNSIVMLTLGTGVGGGIIIDEVSIDGEDSHGSECGHVIIDSSPTARYCSCGRRGHLEAYASATAVVQRTQEVLDQAEESSLNQRLEAGETLSALMVSQEADAGDEVAKRIVFETSDYLAIGIVSVAHVINPSAVILGGAMNFGGHESSMGRRFLQRIRNGVAEMAFPIVAENTAVDFATLGGDAGYIGAAGLARRDYKKAN